jgi:superfamily II DNA or RNA helicase
LVGEQLALYRTQRIRVDLTPTERVSYEADHAVYIRFMRERQLQRSHGPYWLHELMRLSATDREARHALLARQRVGRLLSGCEGKFQTVDALMREHAGEQILIFTEYNDLVYQIARRYLIFPITHETPAAERKSILEGFREGRYRVIVTSRVLNEGVDVPEAKVAIVLGGTAGAREYIQRLGRILRKHEQRQAVLYEVLVRKTVEEGKAYRRRAGWKQAEELYAYQ